MGAYGCSLSAWVTSRCGVCRAETVVAWQVALEATGSTPGWRHYVGDAGEVIGVVDHFGALASGSAVMDRYGFTVDDVCAQAKALLG